jgi:DNA-binding Lrp family transcriptional regulator
VDRIDIALLNTLEHNSRISLKTLATKLNVKTSTIYHRLHKLKESKILDRFSIVLNPEEIGLKIQVVMTIRLKKMVMGKLDQIFLENFAKYLGETYEEIIFCSIGEDEQILIIAALRDNIHLQTLQTALTSNPYVDKITMIKLAKIMKGKKIFEFNPKLLGPLTLNDNFFDDSNLQAMDNGDEEDLKDRSSETEEE